MVGVFSHMSFLNRGQAFVSDEPFISTEPLLVSDEHCLVSDGVMCHWSWLSGKTVTTKENMSDVINKHKHKHKYIYICQIYHIYIYMYRKREREIEREMRNARVL